MGFFSTFFWRFGRTAWRVVAGRNFVWFLLTFALTWLAVESGFDWLYYQASRGSVVQTLAFPAVLLGGLVPLVVPLVIYAVGLLERKSNVMNLAGGLGQAALLGALFSGALKAITGRLPPPHFGAISTLDASHGFQFGFWRGGVFWGWPSTHTTIACAMAFALVAMLPKHKAVRYLAPLYGLYVGLGVSITIHWFSDFLAGAVIGTLIGLAVGRSYLARKA